MSIFASWSKRGPIEANPTHFVARSVRGFRRDGTWRQDPLWRLQQPRLVRLKLMLTWILMLTYIFDLVVVMAKEEGESQ